MKSGDIIIVHSNTIAGRIIRWVTNSWASHIAVYIGDGFVFEARPGGAKAVPLSNYEGKNWRYKVYRLQIDDELMFKFMFALMQKQCVGYDYGQIISILLFRLLHIDLRAQNRRLAICSEIIYQAAQEVGIPVPPVTQAYITPGDFLTWSIAKPVQE